MNLIHLKISKKLDLLQKHMVLLQVMQQIHIKAPKEIIMKIE